MMATLVQNSVVDLGGKCWSWTFFGLVMDEYGLLGSSGVCELRIDLFGSKVG